jgi:hypothetical protein
LCDFGYAHRHVVKEGGKEEENQEIVEIVGTVEYLPP